MRPSATLTIALGLGLAACSSTGSAPTTTPASAAPTVTVTVPPTQAPSAAPTGPVAMPICHDGQTCPLKAADYVTPSPLGFWPGLAISIGSGWVSGENDSGELKLYQAANPDDKLLFWRDVHAINSSTGGKGLGGLEAVAGVGTSADELLRYFTTNTDYKVLSGPDSATTAGGLSGKVITLTTSATADFGDPDCPDNPRCSAFVRDTKHWGTEFYGIGGPEVARMFLTSVTVDGKSHTLIITLDALDASRLESLAKEAQPIIDSVALPTTFLDN